ncbi:g4748 [Coccomyxa elongata]
MAAFKYALLFAALVGLASASRLELNGFTQVLQEVGDEVEGYMTGLIGKDRPDKDADITILTKYIVAPEKAEDFIEAIKKVKDAALKVDGTEIYALTKTKTDNLTFYTYVAFKDWESLKEHLKGEAVRKFIEYISEENIPLFTTPVYVIE